MTQEEAIKILNGYMGGKIDTESTELYHAIELAVDILESKPSLPPNLDEAAQKVEDYYDVGDEHGYLCCHRGDIKDAFKAGTKWMAGQGYVKEGIARLDDCEIWVNMTNTDIKDGDEVIVQIRKK